jgi:Ring finger domain
MQRSTAYGTKPGDNWQQLLAALSSTTFFLVARPGPTVFSVRDEPGKIFKVTISNPHTCSCSSCSTSNLCVHLVFVLLKVLKVPQNHPLSHQTSLTDSEITLVLSGSCGGVPGGPKSTAASRRQLTNNGSKKPDEGMGLNEDGYVHRQELDEDGCIQCPICQDDMSKDQALTWCRKGCGNNIHAKCMQNYSQYKISNKEAAGCPLCRVDWALDLLKADCRGQASLKHTCSPVYCASCTFPQRMKFNRCIECSQAALQSVPPRKVVDFCLRCYTSIGREHTNHHFLTSDASVTDFNEIFWVPVVNHRSLSHVMDKDILTALQQRELSVEDYEALLELDKVVPDLSTQLILSLEESSCRDQRLSTIGTVCWCKGKASASDGDKIRVLPCQHTCHEMCLKKEVCEAVATGSNGVNSLSCAHPGCTSKIFPSLSRRRKRKEVPTAVDTATPLRKVPSSAASLPSLSVSSGSSSVGGKIRGSLRTGPVRREGMGANAGPRQGDGLIGAACPLGVAGQGFSAGISHVEHIGSSYVIKSPSSRRVARKRRESASRLTDEVDSDEDLDPVRSVAGYSSSHQNLSMCIGEQPMQIGEDSVQISAVRRRLRLPRPRPSLTPENIIDIAGLDIHGQGNSSPGPSSAISACTSASTTKLNALPVNRSTERGGGSDRPRSQSLATVSGKEQSCTRRRLEATRSAGSLRGTEFDGPMLSSAHAMNKALNGIAAGPRQGAGSELGIGTGLGLGGGGDIGVNGESREVASKLRRPSRIVVGMALRDAVVSEGQQLPMFQEGGLEDLSFILQVNGQHSSGPAATPSTRIAPGHSGVRKGRPSTYRTPPPREAEFDMDSDF